MNTPLKDKNEQSLNAQNTGMTENRDRTMSTSDLASAAKNLLSNNSNDQDINLPVPQTPAQPPAPAPKGKNAPAKHRPDFFFKNTSDPLELKYMTEADQALYNHGTPRAYILSFAVILFFAIFFLWANFTELDIITRASGKVVSDTPIQKISYLEGGVLEEMYVQSGQKVTKGQVLARVSNALARGEEEKFKAQQELTRAVIARLQAEINETPLEFPDDLSNDMTINAMLLSQTNLYNTRLQQRESELKVLDGDLDKSTSAVIAAESRHRVAGDSYRIATKRVDMMRPLVASGAYPPADFLRDQQAQISALGELEAASQAVSQSKSEVESAKEKINSRTLEWRSQMLEDMSQKNSELKAINTTLNTSQGAVKRSDLTSEVDGKVRQILISTKGGTVSPGATIMEILPDGETLLIEGKVPPSDRAFLHTSERAEDKQEAVVKITSYDFSIYGGLDATLEYISEDTIQDPNDARAEPYYEVRLLTKSNSIHHNNKDYPIMPGMTASVDIITGKRSVLDYLLKPILKATSSAMREH